MISCARVILLPNKGYLLLEQDCERRELIQVNNGSLRRPSVGGAILNRITALIDGFYKSVGIWRSPIRSASGNEASFEIDGPAKWLRLSTAVWPGKEMGGRTASAEAVELDSTGYTSKPTGDW